MLAKERAKSRGQRIPRLRRQRPGKRRRQILENEEELLVSLPPSGRSWPSAPAVPGRAGRWRQSNERIHRWTRYAGAGGLICREKDGKSVAIGYDSRLRSRESAYFAAGVLARNGLTAHV